MKVSFIAAIIVASPVLLWQAWQFVAPGLTNMKSATPGASSLFGSFFFIGGVAFCYAVVIAAGLEFLCCTATKRFDMQPLLQVGDYLIAGLAPGASLRRHVRVAGAGFFLARVGLIDHRFLLRH